MAVNKLYDRNASKDINGLTLQYEKSDLGQYWPSENYGKVCFMYSHPREYYIIYFICEVTLIFLFVTLAANVNCKLSD